MVGSDWGDGGGEGGVSEGTEWEKGLEEDASVVRMPKTKEFM